ncbi:bifunctional diguanylate cyclase/phosphodiesterase [Evansella cellulosilytica]|uniref:bifunctional diguanylate cyclase/phosphodiesterase n=1 Tax=Evansella cellulosilytica TaxID=1413 RepID=UPI001FE17FF2|nr:bifunctional diguanylate cyclase/phosphodiesterase [Evansella cellulosilytica]
MPSLVETSTFNGIKNTEDNLKDELLRTEQRYKSLFHNNPTPIFTMNSSFMLDSCNDAFYILTGYLIEEIHDNFHTFIRKSQQAYTTDCMKKAISGEANQLNIFIVNKQGKEIEVLLSLIPITVNERIEGIYGVIRDISQLRIYEKNLSFIERSLNNAQYIANIGSWDYDPHNDKLYWSKQMFRIFGLDEKTNTAPSMEQYLKYVHHDDRLRDIVAIQDAMEKKKSFNYESRIFRKDGMKRIVKIQGNPIIDNEGNVVKIIGNTHDITEQKEANQRLVDNEKQARIIFNNLDEIIWSIDISSRKVIFCSNGFEQLFGYCLDDLIDERQLWQKVIHEEDIKGIPEKLITLSQGNQLKFECRVQHTSAEVRWIEIKALPIIDDLGDFIRVDGIIRDITEKKKLDAKMHHIAHHDHLTNLPNRRSFDIKLHELIHHAKKTKSIFSVFYLDIDRFKHVNDMLGHNYGDDLLKEISYRLKQVLQSHFIARTSGDEFAVLLHDVTEEEVIVFAHNIVNVMRQAFHISEVESYVTASIGIAFYPKDGENAVTLLKNADTALSFAKIDGKDNYKHYIPEMNEDSHNIYFLEKDMRLALEKEEFYLEYQPKIDVKTKKVIGCEALIRWTHPKRGIVSPAQFIPIAEESDLICDIGNWVIKKVCKQLKKWHLEGINTVPVSINISAQHLLKTSLLDTIFTALKANHVSPSLLELEITETSLIQPNQSVFSTIRSLKKLGVKLSLDDFGVGYSSLTHIRKFPLDTLKIDKSFISKVPTEKDDAVIISSIIEMAHGLGLTILAEGVETEEQLLFLEEKNCDHIQGFLFSKPISNDHFKQALISGELIIRG